MNEDELAELWKEIRILQLQVAMLHGLLVAKAKPGAREVLSVMFKRETLESFERIDAEAEDEG
jgi:hypothetical protein